MGFLDKLKGAVNAVTGGGAKVTLEFSPATAFPGDPIRVKVSAQSTGAEIKSKGIFIDVHGTEHVQIKHNAVVGVNQDVNATKTSLEQSFQIAPEVVIAANETKLFEGTITLPPNLQPSYQGPFARHECLIRARVEAFGNDPDSGFQPIRIGQKS